jgi:Icc-related predicted phosphoesterase
MWCAEFMKNSRKPEKSDLARNEMSQNASAEMDERKLICVRVLTAADMHQSRLHYRSLVQAVAEHRPDVVAIVGDALYALGQPGKYQFSVEECAKILSELPAEHLVFVRGNHEENIWSEFVYAWPHERRQLIGLYGTGCTIGPLVVIGFPCMTGSDETWCEHLPASGNIMEIYCAKHCKPLSSDTETWLPGLIRQFGPAARTFWLMHESPVGLPLSNPRVFNPGWTQAVESYSPRITASGHDHDTPLENGVWHGRLGDTTCINVGQAENDFHYAVLDFEFAESAPSLPEKITVEAYPWEQNIVI